jgi:lipopolysaccharide/colanic/teichoic acid biosynthesis glycosyltransferase
MNPKVSPRATKTNKKKFGYFGIHSNPHEKAENVPVMNGYYFIGKTNANLQKLESVFKHGFVSENIDEAKNELLECLKTRNSVPEVVLCDSLFKIKEIQEFYYFLNVHPIFRYIPFILDGKLLSEKEWGIFKKAKISDEIIVLQETSDDHLRAKCRFLNKVKLREVEINRNIFIQDQYPKMRHFSMLFKRLVEMTISSLILIILSPLFLLISLAIKAETKGAIFYVSKRAGRGYRIFNFIKFRTMRAGADKNIDEYSHLNKYGSLSGTGPNFIKINNDPRVTRVGAILRKSSLDELPQLINVLLGDMSLVGNRPLPLYEASTLTTDACAQRFMAPAGITGLWQIKKRGKVNMSVEERINLDIDYANKSNFMFDLWIMANTPSALFQKENV